jgi:hypothetical protein
MGCENRPVPNARANVKATLELERRSKPGAAVEESRKKCGQRRSGVTEHIGQKAKEAALESELVSWERPWVSL